MCTKYCVGYWLAVYVLENQFIHGSFWQLYHKCEGHIPFNWGLRCRGFKEYEREPHAHRPSSPPKKTHSHALTSPTVELHMTTHQTSCIHKFANGGRTPAAARREVNMRMNRILASSSIDCRGTSVMETSEAFMFQSHTYASPLEADKSMQLYATAVVLQTSRIAKICIAAVVAWDTGYHSSVCVALSWPLKAVWKSAIRGYVTFLKLIGKVASEERVF